MAIISCDCAETRMLSMFLTSSVYYRPKRSFGQGNIFTPVCHSVHRGGSGKENPPRPDTPPSMETPPLPWRTPRHGEPPRDQTPPGPDPPGTRPPPGPDPPDQTPPGKQTPAFGLRSAGTHPTGMHSCFVKNFSFIIPQEEHSHLTIP